MLGGDLDGKAADVRIGGLDRKGKVTRRERFLAEMDAVTPWPRLFNLISPHYHQGKAGRVPYDLERMLRIYFRQQWFNLSDPQGEDTTDDSESIRRFARVELGDDKVPDDSLRLPRPTPIQAPIQGEARTFGSSSLTARCLLRAGCAELPWPQ